MLYIFNSQAIILKKSIHFVPFCILLKIEHVTLMYPGSRINIQLFYAIMTPLTPTVTQEHGFTFQVIESSTLLGIRISIVIDDDC